MTEAMLTSDINDMRSIELSKPSGHVHEDRRRCGSWCGVTGVLSTPRLSEYGVSRPIDGDAQLRRTQQAEAHRLCAYMVVLLQQRHDLASGLRRCMTVWELREL